MRKKTVTFNDIAKYTNFSKTTISRYFNDPESLTLENQQIIKDALTTLGYQENKVARILASGNTEFVGVIMPDLYHHFYSEMLSHILETYDTYGYKFLVFVESDDAQKQRRYLQELMAYKIEGLIVLSHTLPSEELAALDIPVVTIEREDAHVSSVNTDNYTGGYQAAKLLCDCGCDILIHVNSHTARQMPSYQRITGFSDYCREHSVPNEIMMRTLTASYDQNVQELSSIVDRLDLLPPEQKIGVFVCNDTHANTLLNLIYRRYGRFPERYNIIGFDNSPVSREGILPISTIAQQIPCIVSEAMGILVEQMTERKRRKPNLPEHPIHRIVPPVPIMRETTHHAH